MQELYEKIKLCKLGNKKVLQEVINSFDKTIIKELFKFKKENSDIFMNEYDFQDKKSEITLNVLNAIKNMPIESFEYKTDYSVKKYISKTILNRLKQKNLIRLKMNINMSLILAYLSLVILMSLIQIYLFMI